MRHALHSRGWTLWHRGYPVYFGLFALLFIGTEVATPIIMDGSIVPGILISFGATIIVGIMVLVGWRFSYVWLDDDVLEVRQGRAVVRVSVSDVTTVELVRSRPTYIRLQFKNHKPVSFIPADVGYFAGDGERTRKQLYDLAREERGS